MATRTRSTTAGSKRKITEDLENLPSPPTTPKRKTKVAVAVTPTPIRNITKELELAKLQSPKRNKSVYLKTSNNQNQETLYQKAKAVFRRTAVPSRLVGRGNERETMMDFWREHVLENKAGCLYISGMPGTGKTAMLTEVMRKMENEMMDLRTHKVKIVMVNCMTVKEPKQIYTKLIHGLGSPKTAIESDAAKQAEKMINNDKKVINVVILDEIDSLITRDQEVLYKIFEWASVPSSHLVLIGIANALDLTDRILPRLRAKNCEPQLLNFNPYQISEISSIIKDRLYSLVEDPSDPFGPPPAPTDNTPPPLIQVPAIELCARKVAASMGDLRTALDVCLQAVELAEREQKKKTATAGVLGEQKVNTTAATPAKEPEPKVSIAHVVKVLNTVFGSSGLQKLKQLNLQQKIVMGVFFIMLRSGKNGKKEQFTLGKFREHYSAACSDSSDISAVSRTELNDLLSMLETNSIITLGKSKEERSRKIQLNVQEGEITQMINETPLLKNWMEQVIQKAGL